VYQGGWKVIRFGYLENGLPFSVLSVVIEGEVEHPLDVVSVCCNLVFGWVIEYVTDGGVSHSGLAEDVNFHLYSVMCHML
jgi:hypothetical protein